MRQNQMKIEGEFESYIANVRGTGPGGESKIIKIPMECSANIGDTVQVFYQIIKKGEEKDATDKRKD